MPHPKYETNAQRQKAYRERNAGTSTRDSRKQSDKNRYFVAFDGEGFDNEKGEHIFNIFGSNADYITNDAGLSTEQIFDYLLKKRRDNANATFISFYFSYDVNMLLRDVRHDALERLHKTGKAYHFHSEKKGFAYKIEYRPKKMFRVGYGTLIGKDWTPINTITIYDTFGFFQQSFVNAARELKICTEQELDMLSGMKGQRGTFTPESKAEIIEYNRQECIILCRMMDVIKQSLSICNIRLRSWHGAGAIAGALMKKYSVKDHIDTPPEPIYSAVLHSYFGGRIQTPQVGIIPEKIFSHDIVSAYPSIMRDLPSLCGGEWSHTKLDKLPIGLKINVAIFINNPSTLYHIKWSYQTENEIDGAIRLHPFPFRDAEGCIHFPPCGEGWYWSEEVRAAERNWGGKIEYIEYYQYTPKDETKPFWFIDELFIQRKNFKREGNHAQLVLKLGLNSLYGKTAQGTFRDTTPPYQSYIWASMITAGTRAKLYDMAMRNEQSCLMFATDGIYSTSPLETPSEVGKELGQWEIEEYDSAFIIKPGFFTLNKNGETVHRRTRGVPVKSFDFAHAYNQMLCNGIMGTVECPIRRFHGLALGDYDGKWRHWIDSIIKVNFFPAKGFTFQTKEMPPRYTIHQAEQNGISAIYKKGIIKEDDFTDDTLMDDY